MEKHKKYKIPPILEAICEFRFNKDTEWDSTVTGRLYEKVKNEYPERDELIIQEVEFAQNEEGKNEQKITSSRRTLFIDKHKKDKIQTGDRLLGIICSKPYKHWEDFKPRIESTLNKLDSFIDIKGIERLGLRYINKFDIPAKNIELGEYFDFRPFLGNNLPELTTDFILGCQFPFGKNDRCKVTFHNTLAESPKNSSFILDLDYYCALPEMKDIEECLAWVETAHTNLEDTFEGCIKDPLRDIFQEE